MRAPELLLVGLACYLAGAATSWTAHWLRRRSLHRSELLRHWRCRHWHGRYHVAYSPDAPGARFCVKCGECLDVDDLD